MAIEKELYFSYSKFSPQLSRAVDVATEKELKNIIALKFFHDLKVVATEKELYFSYSKFSPQLSRAVDVATEKELKNIIALKIFLNSH